MTSEITVAVRTPGALAAAAAFAVLAGCATPEAGTEAADAYCYRYKHGTPPYNKPRYRVCTTHPVPSPDADSHAKRFEPTPGMATVYLIRNNWGDTKERLPIEVDGRPAADTVPRSMLKVVLPPGKHVLDYQRHGTRFSQPLELSAGEVRFVSLDTRGWLWGKEFAWALPEPSYAKELARQTRLVAEMRLQQPEAK